MRINCFWQVKDSKNLDIWDVAISEIVHSIELKQANEEEFLDRVVVRENTLLVLAKDVKRKLLTVQGFIFDISVSVRNFKIFNFIRFNFYHKNFSIF